MKQPMNNRINFRYFSEEVLARLSKEFQENKVAKFVMNNAPEGFGKVAEEWRILPKLRRARCDDSGPTALPGPLLFTPPLVLLEVHCKKALSQDPTDP